MDSAQQRNTTRKILLIAYHWPPTGGVSVQRWVKLVKYLSRLGWDITVYTPSHPLRDTEDPTLLAQIPAGVRIITQPAIEPTRLIKRLSGKRSHPGIGLTQEEGKKRTIIQRLILWIRANLFIPDARCLWIGPSVRFLSRYIRQNPQDAIITTGPPHSMHLIGLKLKRRLNITWVADFRDPWVHIDYMHRLPLSTRAKRRHEYLERKVVERASATVTVTPTWAEEFRQHHPPRVELIPNGYDPEDFPESIDRPQDERFTLLHMGSMNPDRNPLELWSALEQLQKEGIINPSNFRFLAHGQVDYSVKQSIAEHGITPLVQLLPPIPHAQVASLLQSASMLLLCINRGPEAKGMLTGKLYEYLAAQRPILCLGPRDGEAARAVAECKSGETFTPKQETELTLYLREQIQRKETPIHVGKKELILKYSREQQALQYSKLLDDLIGQ